MPTFELEITTDKGLVRLRLTDDQGKQLVSKQVVVARYPRARWEALFDTRRYVERHAEAAEQRLKDIGEFLGQEIMGPEITEELVADRADPSLLVRLPATENDPLAAAFARVPWEIALDSRAEKLMKQNLAVRVTTDVVTNRAMIAEGGETPVRVLLVFAGAPGSRPRAMRHEREQLLQLFKDKILPNRNVEVDVLCHGVTLRLLKDRILDSGGYHVIHWSGRGHHDCLEMLGDDGKRKLVCAQQLVSFIEGLKRFKPQLVFLSPCRSGALEDVDFLDTSRARGTARACTGDDRPTGGINDIVVGLEGFTGMALALLACGVPQVVAMRYSVSDSYARELAWSFYKRLLADNGDRTTELALALARTDVLDARSPAVQRMPLEHINPLFFGQAGRLLAPARGRSEQLDTWRPKPPLLPALEPPERFVGRDQALTRLNLEWLTPSSPGVALLLGTASIGKTILAAEVIHLWHRRFDWVLSFQAESTPIPAEKFYFEVHRRLKFETTSYKRTRPSAHVYLGDDSGLCGEERYARMCINLIEVLRNEAILLVLDNFEPNIEQVPDESGYRCTDPEWDRLLSALATELSGTGSRATRSRLLVTSRRRPAALAKDTCLSLTLKPLPPAGDTKMSLMPILAPIRGGLFMMGSPGSDKNGRSNERPVHQVHISPFALSKYLVTQKQWQTIMGTNTSHPKYGIGDDLPVAMVTWMDAICFLNKLSERAGLKPCYRVSDSGVRWDRSCDGYRLPTEAEWEYACRAGTETPYSFGNSRAKLTHYAWYQRNSRNKIHPVGLKHPNDWGLHDMLGNVWEWVWDLYSKTYLSVEDQRDPSGPPRGDRHVLRGGSSAHGGRVMRSAYRISYGPGVWNEAIGFRCARGGLSEPTQRGGTINDKQNQPKPSHHRPNERFWQHHILRTPRH